MRWSRPMFLTSASVFGLGDSRMPGKPSNISKVAWELRFGGWPRPRRPEAAPVGLGFTGSGRAAGSAHVPCRHTILADKPPSAPGFRYGGNTFTIGGLHSGCKMRDKAETWRGCI